MRKPLSFISSHYDLSLQSNFNAMTRLTSGDIAPDFSTINQDGRSVDLKRYLKTKWLALYFYPKDFTGGCTLDARGFQKDLARFHSLEAEVAGISADALDDHAAFCDSEGLTFPLLSDPGGKVSQLYGSWLPPFSQRHTFLIDPQGTLRARWVAVRPSGHSQEVLDELGLSMGAALPAGPLCSLARPPARPVPSAPRPPLRA